MDKKIPKARWLRVITPILIACIISFMDRVNISFAMPGGMDSALGISSSMAGLAAGIFFIGYLFLQVPGGSIAVHGSGRKFIACSLVAWAVISVLTGLVTNQYQLLFLRFALGVAEGGMLPVVLTMVSNWFPDAERGRANAYVLMFAPIGGMITAPLSGFILNTLDWRWLFILEGLLSVAVMLFWWFTISDRPEEAKWLSERERHYLITELTREREALKELAPVENAPLKEVFRNKSILKLIVINFFYQTGIYGYTLWLPTILKTLTGGNMSSVGMLAIIPYVGTMLGILAMSLLSDKTGKRRMFIILPLLGFAASLALSVAFKGNVFASYCFLICAGFFLQAATSAFWTIPGKVTTPEVAGRARGVINGLGNLGGFCGPYLVGVLVSLYGQSTAIYALVASLLIAALVTALLPKECDIALVPGAKAIALAEHYARTRAKYKTNGVAA
ncbi:MFS transporter [Rouxiella badensis]|jgi:sugar phosphate permease|uniref:2-ketogluconate transporter n=1 Tax=Rouxiella badensis TaxID=1646377 RepID=A0A1X0WHC0_9GAMM|nr:MFS transporter [Rouxiella badensis]MCC3703193.1 MFS transporter [Rouxiella badensis]MCC3720628.1 MFS transporter [Rouxiella badensis]MCC3730502.1 MFS transporter [Rouxiella badensis]MCC3735542.1 MFS transporter [Rouxiella badensis]MCC3741764.1 MFS transporter [Rouxiella badensis]